MAEVDISDFFCRSSLPIDRFYDRYTQLRAKMPQKLQWLALVVAPLRLSAIVFLTGMVGLAASLVITASIDRISTDITIASPLYIVLIAAFVAESLSFWLKERQELLLTVAIRQIVYRSFCCGTRSADVSGQRSESVLTYPGQISQFAFAVDFLISVIRLIAFIVIALKIYGVNGWLAIVLLVGAVGVSVRLIHLIGRLWEEYIAHEGVRRCWFQRLLLGLPRGPKLPNWRDALARADEIRRQEEQLLRKRVSLQTINGFIDHGALTAVLAAVAIVTAYLWPGSGTGIGLILAARYLYSAAQESLTDYRVIRLGLPMFRKLHDGIGERSSDSVILAPSVKMEVLRPGDKRANEIRHSILSLDAAYLPCNPQIAQPVIAAWYAGLSAAKSVAFMRCARAMGLTTEIIDRFLADASSLSSGERHRACLSMLICEKPSWLVLDDTFASLDRECQEIVGSVVAAEVESCTLLASSPDYIPSTFETTACLPDDIGEHGEADIERPATNHDTTACELPDPAPSLRTTFGVHRLLFGKNVVTVGLGAFILCGAEMAFASVVSSDTGARSLLVFVSVVSLLGTLIGSLLHFVPQYLTPIARLSRLHERLVGRLNRYGSKEHMGPLVGRLGEDFSALQMSIPGSCGALYRIAARTIMLVAVICIGSLPFIFVVLCLLPVTVIVAKKGAQWINPAATAVARLRGLFIGTVTAQIGSASAPSSSGLRAAAQAAFRDCEAAYIDGCIRQADAYSRRTAAVQGIILLLNLAAVTLIAVSTTHALIAPALIVYFAMTLSSGTQSAIEAFQEAGVASLTTQRVLSLTTHTVTSARPPACEDGLDRLRMCLESGAYLTAITGRTGCGKSLLLDAYCEMSAPGAVALIPEEDYYALEPSSRSAIDLLHSTVERGSASILLLDETMKGLDADEERAELLWLREKMVETRRQAVVVLHSRSNLGSFDSILALDGGGSDTRGVSL
ncbi:MAG: hypothetical protein Q4B10_02165 [Actinomycetaceae bacterium]|nr:hypothetical protein [Actinomycetaceae bacterium]